MNAVTSPALMLAGASPLAIAADSDPDGAIVEMFGRWQDACRFYESVPRQPEKRPEDVAAWDAVSHLERAIFDTPVASARGLAVKIAITAISTCGKACPDGDCGVYYDGGEPEDAYLSDLMADAQRLAPDLNLIYRRGETESLEAMFRRWQAGIRTWRETEHATDAEIDADLAKVHDIFNRMIEVPALDAREMAIKSFLSIQHTAGDAGPDAAFLYFGPENARNAEDRAARQLHADLVRTYPDLFAENAAA